MSEPPEICPDHDLIIDRYGCWACGHAGPITDEVWDSWRRWSLDFQDGIRRRLTVALTPAGRRRGVGT